MFALAGCLFIASALLFCCDQIVEQLKRIADALESKNEKDKEAYFRFEQARETLEILAKDPMLKIKHPGL